MLENPEITHAQKPIRDPAVQKCSAWFLGGHECPCPGTACAQAGWHPGPDWHPHTYSPHKGCAVCLPWAYVVPKASWVKSMLLNHPFATEHTQLHGFLSSLLNDSSLAPLLESCQAPCFTGSPAERYGGKAEKSRNLNYPWIPFPLCLLWGVGTMTTQEDWPSWAQIFRVI